MVRLRTDPEVINHLFSAIVLESRAAEGESPVCEKYDGFRSLFLSTTGLEKSRGKLGGPPSKAKYYPVTDSEPVP